jgi:signal transduction histidine kinase
LKNRLVGSTARILNGVFLALDVTALTVAIHFTHGIESDLYVLYLLPILLASYTFGSRGIFTTCAFISLSYVGLLGWENMDALLLVNDPSQRTGLAAAYLNRLVAKLIARSATLVSVTFLWGAFCAHFSDLAQRLIQKLSATNEDLIQKNQHLDATNLELRAIQSQLVHQEKMASLGRLVAGIAHELNNPINFVHGNLPYLTEYVNDLKKLVASFEGMSTEQRDEVKKLKDQLRYDFVVADLDNIIADLNEGTQRIRHIIRNLRSFSRLDEAELKDASISEGIESTLKILSQYYGRDKILAETNFADLPNVLCYAGQLNQVWMNLLSNAAQAVEGTDEAKVSIKTELQDDQVLITIEDNGPGIKKDVQTKIFEPFFTTKPVGQGTGLGLSICHSIIERHRGKIWFESDGRRGTIFKVLLPIRGRPIEDDPADLEERLVETPQNSNR